MLTHAQQRVIKVTLDNIPPYDVLKCRTTSSSMGNTEYLGEYRANSNSWFYQIPDSILDQAQYFQFFGKRNDLPEIKFMHPCFRVIADKDSTLFFTALSYLENTDTLFIHAKFVYQDTIRNSTFYGVNNVIISPKFDLINPSSELRRALTNKNDLHVKHKDLPADQLYDIFHRMISQVPDSHSNTLLLYDEKETFSIEQLMSLRSLLSKQQKQSNYGQKLDEYIKLLTDKFSDIELTNCLTEQKETIISNENKYTLLIFSASWCGPCHKLIPLLKELHEKKKDVIDFVYITLDDPKQLPAWNKLMKEEEIPWRSLTVNGKINEIRDKYKVPSIPHCYLIYPQKMKAEIVEVRKAEDKLKIESLQLP